MPLTDSAPAIVAHRGASAHAPENTLVAFALALLQGADAIECDVRTTADGTLVVLHDETLSRTTGDPRAIRDVTWEQLGRLDDRLRPPSLNELLDCFRADARYVIDVKALPRGREPQLIEALVSRGLRARVIVQSSDHLLLRRLRRCDPLLPTAAVLSPRADAGRTLSLVAPFVAGIAPWHAATDAALVGAARRQGLAIAPWTVNDEAEMHRLADLGVDSLITDTPGTARALLAPRRAVSGHATSDASPALSATFAGAPS